MAQFVGVAHDVDRRNPAILDVEGRGLELAIDLKRDEARQAVDEAVADQLRAVVLQPWCRLSGSPKNNGNPDAGFSTMAGSDAGYPAFVRPPFPEA